MVLTYKELNLESFPLFASSWLRLSESPLELRSFMGWLFTLLLLFLGDGTIAPCLQYALALHTCSRLTP